MPIFQKSDCWDLREGSPVSIFNEGPDSLASLLPAFTFLCVSLWRSIKDCSRATYLALPYICILPYIILPYLLPGSPPSVIYRTYVLHAALPHFLCTLSSSSSSSSLSSFAAKWMGSEIRFSGRLTDSFLLPISHLASCHTELVTRYVTNIALVRITPPRLWEGRGSQISA